MREAVGGALTIQIILVFMVLINAYLAFSVNYTKAFRVKNEIISIIEKNEGFTGENLSSANCGAGEQNAYCEIAEYLNNMAYGVDMTAYRCPEGYTAVRDLSFCYKVTNQAIDGTTNQDSIYMGSYYSVITFVNINIPIIKNVFGAMPSIFGVAGETKMIYSSGTMGEY